MSESIESQDLYLGLDLSTQQLKGIIVTSKLEHVYHAKVEFDKDLPHHGTVKGVFVNGKEKEVQTPVALWLDALDLLFSRIKDDGKVDLSRISGVSGACQQHGSVFWNDLASSKLSSLSSENSLKSQLQSCLAWNMSPNWQDHSTEKECWDFESAVGGKEKIAELTGSRAHHRFTGPQILKLKNRRPDIYANTQRISLVSSFVASVLAGQFVDLDISDVCGMNLWDIENQEWSKELLKLIDDFDTIARKLGNVAAGAQDGHAYFISPYFVKKYDLNPRCRIIPFTGDNPGTILSLPLQANDVIVSLGTSTTALVVTEKFVPSSMYHMFTHPTGLGYMGMLCYCNGALAREQVRDNINKKYGTEEGTWERYSKLVEETPILGRGGNVSIGFYFPLSEIIPNCDATLQRFMWSADGSVKQGDSIDGSQWIQPNDDALRILESQALSIRSRLAPMLTSENGYPRKIYFVGGSSRNKSICEAMARVLMPSEGSFTLDLADACAKGAANLAVFGASPLAKGLAWEEFILKYWDESGQQRVSENYTSDEYKDAVKLFQASEEILLATATS